MRVIEMKIVNTIKAGKVGLYRLSCRDSVEISENEIKVYLWDNLIFYKSGNFIRLSSCGWFSITTKSRLNALLSDYQLSIMQKNHKWTLVSSLFFKFNDSVVSSIPFFDGMEIDVKNFEIK